MILVASEALEQLQAAWCARFDEPVDLEGDGSWVARLAGDLEFRAGTGRVQVSGSLAGQLPRVCDRCLGVYLEAVAIDLTEVCVVEAAGPVGEAVFDENNEVWRVAPEGRLNVTELVRQAVLLALPTRALCGTKACESMVALALSPRESGEIDPRLAVLGRLAWPEESDGGTEEANE